MNLYLKEITQLYPLEERSKMLVINTINQAKERIGIRQGLEELAGELPLLGSLNLTLITLRTNICIGGPTT